MNPRSGRKVCAAGLLAFVLGISGGCRSVSDRSIRPIGGPEVEKLVESSARPDSREVLLVDPRPKAEYDRGHIPGARHMLISDVPERGRLDPSITRYKKIVVYGVDPGSPAARGMTKRLLSAGYENVEFYEGGLRDWVNRGGELMTSTPAGGN